MRAILPQKLVTVEITEIEAKILISLFNKISGPIGEYSPAHITGQLRDVLVEGIGDYEDEDELPKTYIKQLGPANIFLSSSESDLPEDSMVYRG